LSLALLNDKGYAEISTRLRQEGFGPDENANGNAIPQRWKLEGNKVTIDFLLPPIDAGPAPSRVQALEPDFGALIIPGLELAAEEREWIEIDGHTLQGQRIRRKIPVCGPGAFVVLKALAFADRAEPKDAYDLVYVIRRLAGRRGRHRPTTRGPRRAARRGRGAGAQRDAQRLPRPQPSRPDPRGGVRSAPG
jgi:hypothetical protein